MASKVEKIIKKMGKAFTKQTKKLLPEGTKYYLIGNVGATNKFNIILQLDDRTYMDFAQWRQQTRVQVGRNDSEFVLALLQAPAIAIGNDPYFVFDIEERDKMAPTATRPWWEFYCIRTGQTFTPPPRD
jgi:hypothetical protein